MLTVHLANAQRVIKVTKRDVTRLMRLAAPADWADAELSVAVVDGERMSEVNERHTGRRGDTDVLAFPLEDASDALVGEVVVSAARAVEEAAARGIDAADELALYLVHGALHLQGHGDHTTADRRRMYAREREVLAAAGFDDVRRMKPAKRRARSRGRRAS